MAISGGEVRKVLRAYLTPVLEPLGFKKIRQMGGFARHSGRHYTVISFQLSKWNQGDALQFTGEIALECSQPLPDKGTVRFRLPDLFTPEWRLRFEELNSERAESGTEAYEDWFSYRNLEDVTAWAPFLAGFLPWSLEWLENQQKLEIEFPGLTFRNGPVGREPYFGDAPVRSIERFVGIASIETIALILNLASNHVESLEKFLTTGYIKSLPPLTGTWLEAEFRSLGIVLADDPPRPRLQNSRGTDVAQLLTWFEESGRDWSIVEKAHPHLRRSQLLAAQLFQELHPGLL